MVNSVKVSGANVELQKATAKKENSEKQYGWMKEKNGNAFGFKAHNKHYLGYQEQLKAAEEAKLAAEAAEAAKIAEQSQLAGSEAITATTTGDETFEIVA